VIQPTLLDALSEPWWEQLDPVSQSEGTETGLTLGWSLEAKELPGGGFSMLNTSEWPNAAAVCSLSDILLRLEDEPWALAKFKTETEYWAWLRKYYLSPKACAGILRRAEKRGRELPRALQQALTQVATSQEDTQKTT